MVDVSAFSQVVQKNPLILCLTNSVVQEFTANGLLCLGANPLMSAEPSELKELLNISSALLINIGTLNKESKELARKALDCVPHHVPIVLDPVGSGASLWRTRSATEFLKSGKINILRGNASEILSLCGASIASKGVDSSIASVTLAIDAAKSLSKTHNCIVCVSGATDLVVKGDEVLQNKTGHPLMTQVTGMGCLLGAVIAAFVGAAGCAPENVLEATFVMGECGNLAYQKSKNPGTFKAHFLDELYKKRCALLEQKKILCA